MADLPPHLLERVEPHPPPPRAGDYVIYWARVAQRATENPSLDVALSMAAALGLPCFVHVELSEQVRFASDRHHTFQLEGVRALQQRLTERGLGCVVRVHRPGQRQLVLLELAKRAALVVTDLHPVPQAKPWEAAVAKEAPLWRVDASCLAPSWAFPNLVETVAEFRAAATPRWTSRTASPWHDVEPNRPAFVPDVDSLALAALDLPALVAECELDHSVGPVHHTPGGEPAALERWARFLDGAIGHYARDRNDPTRDGTSRLSAYLNLGQLSPFQVAREAQAHRTDGAAKFLDELTWRELAWHFCLRHPAPDTVDALPTWARESLRAHERDGRTFLPSWETLARGQTGVTLWDACQRSLMAHGELSNSSRMTWAKALVPWTRSAREALALMLDLNDRSALDGGAPASILGPLWCLGAFDRPFPETKYFGVVRSRSLDEQAKRFDVAEYERRVHRPSRGQPLVVGVVGAGISGSSCARALVDAGHSVTLFDAASGPGGRLETVKDAKLTFDVGAPFFTVRDERFARFARAWWQERVITEWKPRLVTLGGGKPRVDFDGRSEGKPLVRLVATPGMSALVERLQEGLDVRFDTLVDGLARRDERFGLTSKGEPLGEYDAVVVALPSPLTAQLVDPLSYELASRVREAETAAVWTVTVAFEHPLTVDLDAAFVTVGPLAWVSREASKPERGDAERWVLHASVEWTRQHLEASAEQVAAQLLEAFWATTGALVVPPTALSARQWRHGVVTKPLRVDCVAHESGRVITCGDWCLGSRLESAFLSGAAAAGRLLALAPSVVEAPVLHRQPSQMRLV